MTDLQVLKDNIKVLLKLELNTDINIEGDWKLLWYLCKNDKKELIKDLMGNGFDINITDDSGCTVLMWASCFYGNLKMMKILLELGADVNIKDSKSRTSLFWAGNDNFEMIELIKKYGAK